MGGGGGLGGGGELKLVWPGGRGAGTCPGGYRGGGKGGSGGRGDRVRMGGGRGGDGGEGGDGGDLGSMPWYGLGSYSGESGSVLAT